MQHPIVNVRTYVKVFLALVVLTIVTVLVAQIDLGFMNTTAAVTIAVFKAFLVVTIFMHLKYSARILWFCAGASGVWFVIMVALTLSDFRTRDWLARPAPWLEPPAQHAPATPEAEH